MSQFDYLLQLAQEEADAGHERNAAQLRAVPGMVEAIEYLIMHQPGTVKFDAYWQTNCNAARAALAQFNGETTP